MLLKRSLIVILAMLIAIPLFACKNETVDEGLKDAQTFNTVTSNRLKKIVCNYEDISVTCNITWAGNTCNFESYMNFFRNDIENYQGVFDPDSKVFSIVWQSEDGNITIPVFQYDENQQIIRIYNEDNPTESWDVTYTDEGVAIVNDAPWFSYDSEKKTITKHISSGHTEGIPFQNYEEFSLDEANNIVSTKHLHYVDNGDGKYQLQTETPNYKIYTYDENQNLIKYEEPGSDLVITYEYYDEPIQHVWENTIPIHYVDIFDIYTVSLFRYLK